MDRDRMTQATVTRWATAMVMAAVVMTTGAMSVGAKGWTPPKSPSTTVVATTTTQPTKPPKPPKGATYQCVDGTYSFVKSAKVACWGHGGIARKV